MGCQKTCEEIICTHTGDENFSIKEALKEAIFYSSMPCHETAFVLYNVNTISLVLSRITQIKQSHLEWAMAIAAPGDVLRLLLGHQSFENLQIFKNDGERATLLRVLISSKANLTDVPYLDLDLKLLIEKGEDVNQPCAPDGTALDYVVNLELEDAQIDLTNALISCGAYKTMNPHSLSKPIFFRDPDTGPICITLRAFLRVEDGSEPIDLK